MDLCSIGRLAVTLLKLNILIPERMALEVEADEVCATLK